MMPITDDSDEAVIEEEEEQAPVETEPLRAANSPVMPSAAEVEEHRLTHTPYRSWCESCVRGRGLGEQHRRSEREHRIAIIGLDYWYMTGADDLLRRNELDIPDTPAGEATLQEARANGRIVKCILIRCYKTKCVFGHVIPCKGVDEDQYVVSLVMADVQWLGHVRLILKTDQERSLVALIERAMISFKHKVENIETVSTEHSATYDSQANGSTEVGVRNLRGQFRTMRICLQERIGKELPVHHALVSWLLEHTAMIMNAGIRGEDGLTPWSRARGRSFAHKLFGFAEQVHARKPTKGPQHQAEGNLAARSVACTFLGYCKSSNAYKIVTADGVFAQSRSLARRPIQERWSPDILENIRCTPWDLRTVEKPAVEFGIPVPKQDAGDDAPPTARRLKITMQTLDQYGFTEHCKRCDYIKAFGESKAGLAHSETCRARIIAAMAGDEHGAARVKDAEARLQQSVARHIEHQDKKAMTAAESLRATRAMTAAESLRDTSAMTSAEALRGSNATETPSGMSSERAPTVAQPLGYGEPGTQLTGGSSSSHAEEPTSMDVGQVTTIKEILRRRPGGVDNLSHQW